jgi:glycosyltransferase involved in cell wall biosynthesis
MSQARLRVLLNASAVPAQPAGAGVYSLQLAAALACRHDIDLTVASARAARSGASTMPSPAHGPLSAALWEQARLPILMRRATFDVYHGAHFAVPLMARLPRVATVHDLTFYRLPARYSPGRRAYYRLLAQTAKTADRLIVPSKAVAGDAVRYLAYSPAKMRVVHEAARAGLGPASQEEVGALCGRLGVQRPYLLCVGTAEPGKRAVDALRAIAMLKDEGRSVSVVLAGNPGPLTGTLKREAGRLGIDDRVVFAGYVPDDDLAALYTGALALVFPSLYEGFGLPPLEAMACGTPVIASRAPAMEEVLDEGAIFVPLRDPNAIRDEVCRLIENESWRSEWAQRGRQCSARYSWDRAAAKTMDVYREVARI